MKRNIVTPALLVIGMLTSSFMIIAATATSSAPQEETTSVQTAAQTKQATGLLKSFKDIQILVKGIQDIGGVLLTLFSFGDLAQGLNKTTNPLFAIINEFDKETPDTDLVLVKLHEMESAQPLILKDAERLVKTLVAPVVLFSPLVVKNLRKQGKVITKNGVELFEAQKCITKEVSEKVMKDGKQVVEIKQVVETIKQEVPVKDAAKYIADFIVCQIFKLLNSYHQAVETLLHKYIEIKDTLEQKMSEIQNQSPAGGAATQTSK